jgi:hypothetical protein
MLKRKGEWFWSRFCKQTISQGNVKDLPRKAPVIQQYITFWIYHTEWEELQVPQFFFFSFFGVTDACTLPSPYHTTRLRSPRLTLWPHGAQAHATKNNPLRFKLDNQNLNLSWWSSYTPTTSQPNKEVAQNRKRVIKCTRSHTNWVNFRRLRATPRELLFLIWSSV